MNKKDIANIRKQFKVNNDLLKINDIFNVYIMKESSDIYHHQSTPFELLEEEQKELFMDNFKKVLSGQLDEKLFELKFQRDVENNSQLILHQGLLSNETEEWKAQMLQLVEKMLKDKQYEMDVVVTFIRGEYRKPMKKSEESEESDRDTVYSNPFILCSMNKTQDPKKELLFDYVEKEFKYNVVVDPIINLKAPISGFLFPCFTDNAADVNHILYAARKKYELDYHLIEEVLNAEEIMTAQEDKVVFEEIVKKAADNQLNTSTLSNVYEEIHRVVEENEEEEEVPKLDYKDVENVLKSSGVENVNTEKVEDAFKTVIDDEKYEFKASNVLPKYNSKSIKIKTKVADISISPQDLRYVRQVELDGKLRLMIDLEENTVIEGFEMIPEALFHKASDQEE
ncbi:DUF4317 domain-containing protein [Oceanobacillus halotolerans]|uniref:DUF4317 domain-containing protein n=1 Tax=Oceanobacillus halotolerans TaxID=2663380 RepID=UPI0013DC9855|nr:DUF4317 domain-containing protein [Oceanobacillus halotolerans]